MIQGLLGKKLSHSYSKTIHNKFYEITGINGDYQLFEVANKNMIYDFLMECKSKSINHINVTIPYKKEVMKYLDEISNDALLIDAVNTISIKDGKLYGYNSDYFGFIKTLQKEHIPVKNKKWVILGNGGSSKSVKVALTNLGASTIKIASRTAQGEMFITYDELTTLKGYDGLVNTTPVGMYPNIKKCVIDELVIKRFKYAIDLIYNPEMTLFLSYAKKNQLKYANGMYMLVAQAIKSQEIWNNASYDDDIIEKIYIEMVKEI